jgi:GNAT superfamily N-acetyltransferase
VGCVLFFRNKIYHLLTHSIPVLTNIVTREPLRRHGAGSLILKWGLRKAAAEGVPSFLEAMPDAKSLYEKHGFREVGRQLVDCSKYGIPRFSFEVSRMRAEPS